MSGCCDSCGSSSCACNLHELTGEEYANTLLASLIPVVDCARQAAVDVGARPYSVALIWTQWSGGERGEGVEEVVCRTPIVPTPLVADIGAVRREFSPIGSVEAGQVKVSEISGRYTEDFLNGLENDGSPVPDDQDFFWEIVYFRADGPGPRRRFFPASVPHYDAEKIGWSITLTSQNVDRARNEDPGD